MKSLNILIVCCILILVLIGCTAKRPVRQAPVVKEQPQGMVCKPLQPVAPTPAPLPVVPQGADVDTSAKPSPPVEDISGAAVITQGEVKQFTPLATIHFALNSYHLDAAAKRALDSFYQLAKEDTVDYVLEGFCDPKGPPSLNIKLGERRAGSVKAYLVKRGIDAKRLSVVSYGEEYPVMPGYDEKAGTLNRRVEIVKSGSPQPGSAVRYGKTR